MCFKSRLQERAFETFHKYSIPTVQERTVFNRKTDICISVEMRHAGGRFHILHGEVLMSITVHVILMVTGVVVLLAAGAVGATDRGSRNLSLHKLLGGLGLLIVLAGFAGLLVTKALRPTLPHFYLALLAIIFLILVPVSGLLFLKAAPARKAALRKSHRADAAVFFGLVVLAVIFGLLGLRALPGPR